MTNDEGHKPEGAPERSPKAGVGAFGRRWERPKRFSVQRKMAFVPTFAASRWIWWPDKQMSPSPGSPSGAIVRLLARLPP